MSQNEAKIGKLNDTMIQIDTEEAKMIQNEPNETPYRKGGGAPRYARLRQRIH